MAMQGLRSFVTRKFSSRRIPRAHAALLGSPAAAGARRLHTLRDVVLGDTAPGAVAAAAFVAFVGFVYFKKADEVTDEGAGREDFPENKNARDQRTALEITGSEDMSMKDGTMEARFEVWMKKYGRTYRDEEERAQRFKIFKANAEYLDKLTASSKSGARFVTNSLSDLTKEEFQRTMNYGTSEFPVEEYRKFINSQPLSDKGFINEFPSED